MRFQVHAVPPVNGVLGNFAVMPLRSGGKSTRSVYPSVSKIQILDLLPNGAFCICPFLYALVALQTCFSEIAGVPGHVRRLLFF